MQVIQRCAEDRAGVITDELKTTANHGKHIWTSVLNGGAPPGGYEGNAFLMRLSRASKFLRGWLVRLHQACAACARRMQSAPSRKPPHSRLCGMLLSMRSFPVGLLFSKVETCPTSPY
jgi:hypothetical protein